MIQEFATYKRKKVSGIRVIAIAACLAILVTSIPMALIMNRKDSIKAPAETQSSNGGDDVVIDDTSAVKVIYCSSSIKEELIDKYKGQDVEIRDSAEIEVSSEEKEVDPSTIEGIPARLYLTVDGNELVCTFSGYVYSTDPRGVLDRSDINIARYEIDNYPNEDVYLDYSLYVRSRNHER